MTGSVGGVLEGGVLFDLNSDHDVDLDDFERFQRAFVPAPWPFTMTQGS